MRNYKIVDDDVYKKYLNSSAKPTSKTTIIRYNQIITRFCKDVDMSFEEIVNQSLSQQTQDDYNVNESLIADNFNKYLDIRLESKVKPQTINKNVGIIRNILSIMGVELPYWRPLNLKSELLLKRSEIFTILNNSNIYEKAYISFYVSSLIPQDICLNFKISDFIEATYKYHECKDLNSFLTKAPYDIMIGVWKYHDSDGLKIAFNSPESSNYILYMLKNRIFLNPYLSEDDYLFISCNQNQLNSNNIKQIFKRKTDYLKKIRENRIWLKFELGYIPCTDEFIEGELSYLHSSMKRKISKFGKLSLDDYYSRAIHESCNNPIIYNLLEHESIYTEDVKIENGLLEYYRIALQDLIFKQKISQNDKSKIRKDIENYLGNDFENVYFKTRLELYCFDLFEKDFYFKDHIGDYSMELDNKIFNENREFDEWFGNKDNVYKNIEEIPINDRSFVDNIMYNLDIVDDFFAEINLINFDNYNYTFRAYIIHKSINQGLITWADLLEMLQDIEPNFPFDELPLKYQFKIKKYGLSNW